MVASSPLEVRARALVDPLLVLGHFEEVAILAAVLIELSGSHGEHQCLAQEDQKRGKRGHAWL